MGDHGASDEFGRDEGASEFGKEVGQIHEAIVTGRSVGAGRGFWAFLTHNKAFFIQVYALYRRWTGLRTIDLNTDFHKSPNIPSGWSILESDQIFSRLRGKWSLNSHDQYLHLTSCQRRSQSRSAKGTVIRAELEGEIVVPANQLDFYLRNPDLIPEDWRGKEIVFWGSIFRDENNELCVRYLVWEGLTWRPKKRLLTQTFGIYSYAFLHNNNPRFCRD